MSRHVLLCPTDFSPPSEAALRYALELAADLGDARVDLVTVYQPLMTVMSADVAPLLDPKFEDSVRARLREKLDELVKQHSTSGVAIEGHLLEGQIAPAVLEHADAIKPRLIVLATHGRSGLKRMLLGSIAERLVRGSEHPVCTVRVPD